MGIESLKIGFIGAGNMGGALAKAAAKTKCRAGIMLADKDTAKASALAEELGVSTATGAEIAANCDFIFLGVKPQMMADMLAEIKPALEKRSGYTLVSMMAGVKTEKICAELGFDAPVIRIMPNTPVSVGEGMILYTANDAVTEAEINTFLHALSKAGKPDEIAEDKIDAASALSGCGPAFVYLFAEALADGAVECGLARDKANLYAAQTLLGAAELLLQSGKHPGELKDAVCSPGGTTIAGVHALEENSFRSATMNAVTAAYEKTLKLKK